MYRPHTSKILSLVIFDQIKAVLYFPFWWYSRGFLNVLKGSGSFIRDFEQTLGFMIWIKNLFVPMYGQRDIAGRLISFFLRLFEIIFKGIILLIFIILNFIYIIFWLLIPIFIIYQILIHI